MANTTYRLDENRELLTSMLSDMEQQTPIYLPGPYWQATARRAVNEIRRMGIDGFRGSTNLIGMSYADPLIVDWRLHLRDSAVKSLFRLITSRLRPFNTIYENQVALTRNSAARAMSYAEALLSRSDRIKYLLGKYRMPYSLLGGCLQKVNLEGHDISIHYLGLLNEHDTVADVVDFTRLRTVFEIGGGFGASLHLVLANYPNIRKAIYLDIPPNLYVGTQYLRAFYGSAVFDYNDVTHRNSLTFSADDNLEILCVAPWQIELLQRAPDILFNSHSFVEMPKVVVRNYAEKAIEQFGNKDAAIALISYTNGDAATTLGPEELPGLFPSRNDFAQVQAPSLLPPYSMAAYFVSPGRFGRKL